MIIRRMSPESPFVRFALFFCVLTLFGCLPATSTLQADPLHETDFIFDPEEESHGHVHASCIVACPNGDLLAVWYENGPTRDDYYYTLDADKSDNVRIGAARKREGAAEWNDPFVISDTFGVSDNNPCMVIDNEDRLWLFHTAMLGAPLHTWGGTIVKYKVSSDYDGPGVPQWDLEDILVVHPNGLDAVVAETANDLRRFADRNNSNEQIADELLQRLGSVYMRRFGWMTRAHPTILSDGTLLLPFANENFNAAAMAFTRDGKTWTFSEVVPGELGITQPTVAHLSDGRLLAFFRDAAGVENRIHRSISTDNGRTWSPAESTDLPNPGAGIELISLKSGELLLVYNDKADGPRDSLAISISDDDGKTWKWTRHVESIPGGRFDYPSVVQANDGTLHLSYSYNLETIKHVHFNVEWVKDGE